LESWFTEPKLPLGRLVKIGITWLQDNAAGFFDAVTAAIDFLVDGFTAILLHVPFLVVVLAVYFPLLAAIRLRGYVGMLALLLASWAAGWLLGGPGADNRRALALTTSLRNVGVGLVIATTNFGGTAAVTAVLAYGIFEIVGSVLLALAWGRAPLARDE